MFLLEHAQAVVERFAVNPIKTEYQAEVSEFVAHAVALHHSFVVPKILDGLDFSRSRCDEIVPWRYCLVTAVLGPCEVDRVGFSILGGNSIDFVAVVCWVLTPENVDVE